MLAASATSTTVKNGCGGGGRVKGEGRVISINAKFGFLAAQGINSKVFIIPSSLRVEAPFPPLTEELHIDDLVTFEASEQVERNGAKYLAIDGSVKLKQRGKDVMVEGEGKIVRLDVVRGCFGFIDSAKVGSVFFNISAVRPATSDVAKVLKVGQRVKFRALPNSEQPNCKWRASVVCSFARAQEFLHAAPSSGAGAKTSAAAATAATAANNAQQQQQQQSYQQQMFANGGVFDENNMETAIDSEPSLESVACCLGGGGGGPCASSSMVDVDVDHASDDDDEDASVSSSSSSSSTSSSSSSPSTPPTEAPPRIVARPTLIVGGGGENIDSAPDGDNGDHWRGVAVRSASHFSDPAAAAAEPAVPNSAHSFSYGRLVELMGIFLVGGASETTTTENCYPYYNEYEPFKQYPADHPYERFEAAKRRLIWAGRMRQSVCSDAGGGAMVDTPKDRGQTTMAPKNILTTATAAE